MPTELFHCVAGSRLFGTATPTSDTDYKAVHVPSARSILLGTADAVINKSTGSDKTSNTKDDIDMISFPLHKYLHGVTKMEVNSLEMLFANNTLDDFLLNEIVKERFRLMTSNKKSFIGFAKQQAMRYAVRGDRLDALVNVVEVFKQASPHYKLSDQYEVVEHLRKMPNVTVTDVPDDNRDPASGRRDYTQLLTVFGRSIPLTMRPAEAMKVYQKPIDEAGKRTVSAANGGGPDWKGLYHSQRVVDEGIELFSTGELVFPCRQWTRYMLIRTGQADLEDVLCYFEDKLQELEELTPISDFRETADTEWVDEFVASVYEQKVVEAYETWRSGL